VARAHRHDRLLGRRFPNGAAIAAALGVAVLASCSWMPSWIGHKDEPAGASCPVAAVLKPLANTAKLRQGSEQKPFNVEWYGIYTDISATCTTTGDTLRAALDSIIVAERGPSVRGNDVDFNYFVALTTASDQRILGKSSFSVHITVPDRNKRAGINDHVEVAFATGGRPISDLNITVGFQQSPEAIEFYKHYRGR
jgi:hypothetical protein